MKCPLLVLVSYLKPLPGYKVATACLGEECAWWLDDIRMCSIRTLALETRYIQFRLQDLVNKMPPGKG